MIHLIGTIKFMDDDDLKNLWTSEPLSDREIQKIETIKKHTANPKLFQKGILRYQEDDEIVKINLLGRFKLLLDARNGDAFSIKMSTLDFWRMAEPISNAKYLRSQKALIKLVAAKNVSIQQNLEDLKTKTRTRASSKIINTDKEFKTRLDFLDDLDSLNYR